MRRTAKLSFVYLLLFILSLSVVQQSYGQGHFGLKVGINASTLGRGDRFFDKDDRFSWRPSWYVGGYSQVKLNAKYFLQPELLYTLDAFTDNDNSSPVRKDMSFQHLNFPVLLGYKQFKQLSFVLGPELSYLLHVQMHAVGSGKYNETNNYSKWTYGIDAGLNYRINNRVGIDFRYAYGINKLKQYYIEYYTDGTNNVIGYSTFKKRALQVGLQCNF
jgi:Outer membrane protein beta-barrel domain